MSEHWWCGCRYTWGCATHHDSRGWIMSVFPARLGRRQSLQDGIQQGVVSHELCSKPSPTQFYNSFENFYNSKWKKPIAAIALFHRGIPGVPILWISPRKVVSARFGAVKRITWSVPLIVATTCRPGRREARWVLSFLNQPWGRGEWKVSD